jgi:hypothetical protein
MQMLKSKCTTHDQVLSLPLILVIFLFFFVFLCVTSIFYIHYRFPKAMVPFQVPKNFKFKLFFSGEPNATSNLLPHVASNVQAASSSTISPS